MHKIKKMRGFSLVETTISLIVVGILLSALSPVISKKIQGTSVIAGPGVTSNGRVFVPDPNDPDCENGADATVNCKLKIPAGVDLLNISLLSGGGVEPVPHLQHI